MRDIFINMQRDDRKVDYYIKVSYWVAAVSFFTVLCIVIVRLGILPPSEKDGWLYLVMSRTFTQVIPLL